MGLAGVKEASEDYQARKNSSDSKNEDFQRVEYLKIDDGEEVTVRPLEEGDDFTSYYVHSLGQTPAPWGGVFYPEVPCPDPKVTPDGSHDCKGCEDGIKRSYKFALNVIWRDAPVKKRDSDGKPERDANRNIVFEVDRKGQVKREDQVVVWNGGIQVAEDLDHLHGKYKGLAKRDWDVFRKGVKKNTSYRVTPSGDPEELTKQDENLATDKFDIDQIKRAPAYDDFYDTAYRTNFGKSKDDDGGGASVEEAKTHQSPFARKRGN